MSIDRATGRPSPDRSALSNARSGPGQTGHVAVGIADNVRGQPAAGIDPARLHAETQPRKAEGEDGLALARGEIAPHPDETPPSAELFGQRVDVDVGQDRRERLGGLARIPDQAGIGIEGMRLQGRGEHLAGAVEQVAARFGAGRLAGDRRGRGRPHHGDVHGTACQQQKTDGKTHTHDPQARTGGIDRPGFIALDPQQAGHVGRRRLRQRRQRNTARPGGHLSAEGPQAHQPPPPTTCGWASA